LLLSAFLAIAVFAFVLVVANVLKEVAGPFAAGQLTLDMFLYLAAIAIPGVLPYALPLGLLTAVLLVLGRLSAQNELIAMKAAGMSLWRIAAPVYALALMGTALSAIINIYYAPIADAAFRRTLEEAARTDPLRFFTPRTFVKDFGGYVIFVDRREGAELRRIHVWELDEQNRAVNYLQADRATIEFNAGLGLIVLTAYDGTVQKIDPDVPPNEANAVQTVMGDSAQFLLPLDDLLGDSRREPKLSFQTLDSLMAKRAQAKADEGGGDAGAFARRIEVQTAIQKKFALSFAVLSLCVIAIPLGIKASRTETYANFAIAFALANVYFIFFVLCSWAETRPAWRPDLLVWLPNAAFQSLGAGLFLRSARH